LAEAAWNTSAAPSAEVETHDQELKLWRRLAGVLLMRDGKGKIEGDKFMALMDAIELIEGKKEQPAGGVVFGDFHLCQKHLKPVKNGEHCPKCFPSGDQNQGNKPDA
jgi:hypothetical protein